MKHFGGILAGLLMALLLAPLWLQVVDVFLWLIDVRFRTGIDWTLGRVILSWLWACLVLRLASQ